MADLPLNPQVSVGIDPRIKRRRVEVRRREGRRRLAVLVGAVGVVGLAAATWGGSRSPLLDVDRVVVAGEVRSSAAEVVEASGVRRGEPLVDIDPEAAAEAAERLPWVLRATVRRQWNGTVSIHVAERAPVAAAVAGEGVWALVDAQSRVLATVPVVPSGLPTISGRDPVGAPGSSLGAGWAAVLAVATAAPPPLLERVTAITQVEGEGVELSLASGATVRFGPAEQVTEKFTAIATVLARVETRDLAVVDVRIPRTPVLTRQQSPR